MTRSSSESSSSGSDDDVYRLNRMSEGDLITHFGQLVQTTKKKFPNVLSVYHTMLTGHSAQEAKRKGALAPEGTFAAFGSMYHACSMIY